MRRGLFGGTFDPVHDAHLELAVRARDACRLDEIVFIPAWSAPHKQGEPHAAAPEHRLAMLRLAVSGSRGLKVSDAEIIRRGISYTIDTVRYFRKLFPDDELFWIMGADSYETFDSWKDAAEIRKEARLLVAGRPGAGIPLPENSGVGRVEMPAMPIASSEVRECLARGRFGEARVPRAVLDYIREHHLYGVVSDAGFS